MHKKKHAKISCLFAALFTLFCLAGMTGNARAAFVVYICDDALCTGGGDTIVIDGGAGDNFPGSTLPGQINAGAFNVGGFSFATNIGQSNPVIGSSSQPQLDLTFSAVTSDNGTHTIYLYASNTDFLSGNTFLLTLGGTQPPAGGNNSITGSAYGGNSNDNLNLASLLATNTTSNSPYGFSVGGTFSPGTNPFGLTIGLMVTRSGAGTTTGDLFLNVVNETSAVPETGSSALLTGLGVLGLFGLMHALRPRGAASRAL